jgi:hypothetical protein
MANIDKKTLRVLEGFSKLDHNARGQLMEFLFDYQKNIDSQYRRELLKEASASAGVPLGPTNQDGCPCCGR